MSRARSRVARKLHAATPEPTCTGTLRACVGVRQRRHEVHQAATGQVSHPGLLKPYRVLPRCRADRPGIIGPMASTPPLESGSTTRTRIQRWQEPVLVVTAVIFIVAFSVPIISPQVSPAVHDACEGLVWTCWAIFGVDFLMQWRHAEAKGRFLRRHVLDVIALLLPVFQMLRLVRLVTLLRVLNRLNDRATTAVRGRVMIYVLGANSLIIYLGALAVLGEERAAHGQIQTFGDALWWATVTVTTVGYGDYTPVTVGGRLVAGGLMVCGVALLGIVTASLASWLIERVRDVEEQAEAATRADIARLSQQLEQVHAELVELRTGALSRSTAEGAAGATAGAAAGSTAQSPAQRRPNLAAGGVVDLADQLLDDVLEEEHPDNRAGGTDDPGQV